jgi:polysaccharide biosynthesis protein PelE
MFIFFVPILGIMSSLIITRWLCLGQQSAKMQSIRSISLSDPLRPLRKKYGVSGLKIHLQSHEFPLYARVNALKSLSAIPADKSNNLIRTVLPDKQDELRLLAFKLIDQQEKKIVKQINSALELSKNSLSENEKTKLYKWLALEYWELVHCSLIEPVMLNFVLNQTIHYINLSKEHSDNDPSLWYLLGRIHLIKTNYELAINAFEQAIKHGYLKNRVLPYLAEAYFFQHKYHETKQLLSSIHTLGTGQISHTIIAFWSQQHA